MARKLPKITEAEYKATKQRLNEMFNYHTPSYTIDEEEANKDLNFEAPEGGDDMGAPQGDMGGGQQPPMGGEEAAPQDGGMPPMGGGEQQPPMGGDEMGAPQGGGTEGPEGFNPQGDITSDDFNAPEQPSADDNVVDISDLTDAQEATDDEIAKLGGKFEKVLNSINAFTDLIKQNDAKIEDLKKEFERRNPTDVQRMTLHTAQGGPFNLSPEQYWEKKEAEGNYSPASDNNGKDDPQYAITGNDLKSIQDWRNIAASISPDDEEDDIIYSQNLKNFLGI